MLDKNTTNGFNLMNKKLINELLIIDVVKLSTKYISVALLIHPFKL